MRKNIFFLKFSLVIISLLTHNFCLSQTKFDKQYNSYWDNADKYWAKGDPNSVEEYLRIMKKLYKLTKDNKKDSLQAYVLSQWGASNFALNKNFDAQYNEAIKIAKKRHYLEMLVMLFNDFGQRLSIQGNNNQSIVYFQQAIKYCKIDNNQRDIITSYLAIGQIYVVKNQDDKALLFFKEALFYATKLKKDDPYFAALMPSIYFCLARSSNNFKQSEYYLQKAEVFIKEVKSDENSILLNQKGYFKTQCVVDKKFALHEKTIKDAKMMLAFAQEHQDEELELMAYELLLRSYLSLKNYKIARKYLDLFDDFQVKKDKFSKVRNLNRFRAEIYSKTGDFKRGYAFLDAEIKELDSLIIANKNNAVEEFSVKYEVEKSKAQIANQKLQIKQKETNRNISIFISLLVLLIIFFVVRSRLKSQKQAQRLIEISLEKEKEYNQFRTQFLENISHEIRTPLTLMNGYLQLASECNEFENCIVNIEKAKQSGNSVLDNANELLNLLKFDFDKDHLNKETFQLEPYINRIFFTFESAAVLKKIDLVYQNALSGSLTIDTDKNKLEKIINNLISNAIKYSNENTTITLSLLENEQTIEIRVKDQGIGISAVDTEKIFTRFFQSSSSLKVGGFGIGLSLAKEFSVLLGGNLSVESEIGKGSEFCLSLPKKSIQSENTKDSNPILELNNIEEAIVNADEKKISTDNSKPKILIVEDSVEMNIYYKEILSNTYECYFASDGNEGVKMAQKKQYDLVISDMMMPNLDGFGFKKLLKMQSSYDATPFVFVTAKSLTGDKIKAFEMGIDDYIIKPFDKNELLARLEALLSNAASRKNWVKENPNEVLPPHEKANKKLLNQIEAYVIENLSEENIKASDIASKLSYTQRGLSNAVQEITGMTLVQFILEIRLQEGYRLIQNKEYKTINEVRYAIGIESVSYFNRTFKNRFGINPSQLQCRS